ncbi:MAG: ribonuclease Z [Clostridia bacterium]|nr:ribonuclease Z [Clostridia bacterium]
MKISILGTGCIWTKRACASYLIDDNILVDAGSGALKQLFKNTKNLLHHEKIGKIKLILITHFHLDHYFDIVPLMWKLASDKFPEFKATIICPRDGEEKIKQLCRLGLSESTYKKLNFKDHITFVDAASLKDFSFGEYEISSLKMEHGDIECFGYIFKRKNGKTVSFTGDSTMCENMKYMIDNSHLAFVDMAGTDISSKHYNIIDGIETLKEYEGRCCIVPCHLTSQAFDYCVGKINLPKDLMVINPDYEKPYDFHLKEKKVKKIKNDNFVFAQKKFEKLKGKMVNLTLKKTFTDKNSNLPTYVFNVLLPKTDEIVGKISYGVAPENDDIHFGNVDINMTKDLDLSSVKYDCCQLIKQVAKHHKAHSLNLTCDPNDHYTRRVFDSLGAYLKEIKTITNFDDEHNRELVERCIWVWEF